MRPPWPVSFYAGDRHGARAAGALPPWGAAFADLHGALRRASASPSLHAMQPPLAALLALQAHLPALAVKVAPGVRSEEIPAGCSVEFVSHAAVCKEAVLWFGPLAGNAPCGGLSA